MASYKRLQFTHNYEILKFIYNKEIEKKNPENDLIVFEIFLPSPYNPIVRLNVRLSLTTELQDIDVGVGI